MDVAGYRSTSVVKYKLELLAEQGHMMLVDGVCGQEPFSGVDYAAGWDTAARLAGNPNA
jgi:hypothetical protein